MELVVSVYIVVFFVCAVKNQYCKFYSSFTAETIFSFISINNY
jgi:hypothetical protein